MTKPYFMYVLYGNMVIHVALYRVLCIPLKSTWVGLAVLFHGYLTAISYIVTVVYFKQTMIIILIIDNIIVRWTSSHFLIYWLSFHAVDSCSIGQVSGCMQATQITGKKNLFPLCLTVLVSLIAGLMLSIRGVRIM